jgi:hypothetical protein
MGVGDYVSAYPGRLGISDRASALKKNTPAGAPVLPDLGFLIRNPSLCCAKTFLRSAKTLFRGAKTLFRGAKTLFRGAKTLFRCAKTLLRSAKTLFRGTKTLFRGAKNRIYTPQAPAAVREPVAAVP